MTPQELKNSILQLAIQGKLVEQCPEEGTGEELYQQIQKEKKRMIEDGELKRTKTLPDITEDTLPCLFPNTWKVCYMDDISFITKLAGFEYTKNIAPNLTTSGIPLFKGKNVQNGNLVLNFESYIAESISNELTRSQIQKKCLLTPYVGTIGNIAIFDGSFKAHLGSNVGKIELINSNDHQFVMEEYVLYYLRSNIGYQELTKYKKATAQESISIEAIRSVIIAIPPLAEQQRIVAKIEELLPYINRYEQAWIRLENFNKCFPDDMKKSILQMAIQGKLVEQRPEDGTAEELYQQIQVEKRQLIKAGKIKNEKPLPRITEKEVPFDIPKSWKWVRLKDIISVLGDGIHGTPEFDNQGEYFFVNGNNLAKGKIIIKSDTKRVSRTEYEKYRKPLNERTILLSINGTIGNYAYYTDEPVILGKSACYFSLINGISKDYICYLLNTKWFSDYAVNKATQTTIKNVSLKAMRMFPIALPPFAEQKRIVAKLEELLPLCEILKRG